VPFKQIGADYRDKARSIGDAIGPAVVRRRIFNPPKGFFGFGGGGTRADDEVWVLLGGESVVIDGEGEPKPRFTMSGTCYVHGFIDGEAMGPGKKEEVVCLD
jgi:hypothetical protein